MAEQEVDDIEVTQFKDGHWYYRTREEPEETVGPFMTKTCALQHAKDGTFRVID